MRLQLRSFIASRILLVSFAALILGFLPEIAHATVTIVEVDPAGVSAVEGSGSSTVIFGGVAGDQAAGPTCDDFVSGTIATCDNCGFTASGDAGLHACNKRRIRPDGVLHIRLSSDKTDGYPIMVVVNTSTSESKVTASGTESSLPKGTVGDLTVQWKDICNTFSGGNASCDPTSDEFQISVKVGVDLNNNGIFDTEDDNISIKIRVRDGLPSTGSSLTGDCATSPTGLCYFEVKSGDEKLSLVNLQAVSGFPLTSGINFKYVRVLFAARDASTPANTGVFADIHPGSDYADLEIGGTAAGGNLSLSPNRVVGLTNDQIYDVKVASVDAAGNTGYYTPASQDFTCENTSSQNGGIYECHVARPSEVVGILSEPVNCFVATAAYGSPMEKEVTTFREFRERFLAHNFLGKKFIRWYYLEGPKLAKIIAGNETRKSIARAALALPLAFSKFALREGGVAAVALLVLIFGTPISIAIYSWAKRRKRGLRA